MGAGGGDSSREGEAECEGIPRPGALNQCETIKSKTWAAAFAGKEGGRQSTFDNNDFQANVSVQFN